FTTASSTPRRAVAFAYRSRTTAAARCDSSCETTVQASQPKGFGERPNDSGRTIKAGDVTAPVLVSRSFERSSNSLGARWSCAMRRKPAPKSSFVFPRPACANKFARLHRACYVDGEIYFRLGASGRSHELVRSVRCHCFSGGQS